jgi:hypothetical protein
MIANTLEKKMQYSFTPEEERELRHYTFVRLTMPRLLEVANLKKADLSRILGVKTQNIKWMEGRDLYFDLFPSTGLLKVKTPESIYKQGNIDDAKKGVSR